MKKMKKAFAVLMSTSLVMSQMSSMALAEEQKAGVASDDKLYEAVLNCDLVQDFSCSESVHVHTSDCYHEHQTACYETSLATDSNASELTCAISTEEPQCEQTEHEHGDACYTEHEHNDGCYDMVEVIVEKAPENQDAPKIGADEPKNSVLRTATGSNPDAPTPIAAIGDKEYYTLKDAIDAANKVETDEQNPVVIELLDDIVAKEKLVIKNHILINGNGNTITREGGENDYLGTFFVVNSGCALTLDDDLTLDGGNEWEMDLDTYEEDLYTNWNTSVPKSDSQKWFTVEEGAPIATAYMLTTTGGTINLNDVTVKNNYSLSSGIVSAGANSTINLSGAQITHNASVNGSGLVVNASGADIQITMEDDTSISENHVGGNHGIFKVYSGAKLTINGGTVEDTTGWDANGTVIGSWWGHVEINGGTICGNSSVYGPSNGRNAAVYIHTQSKFTMTGGQICHNVGRSKGGIDAPFDNGSIVIASDNGINEDGTDIIVVDNVSNGGWTQYDVNSGLKSVKSGVYTQDLDSFCVDGFTCIPYDDDDTRSNDYIVVDHYRVDYYVVDGTAKALVNSENLYLEGKCAADIDLFAPAFEYTDAETNKTITQWYTDEAMTQEYDFTKLDETTEILKNVKLYGAVEVDDNNTQEPGGDDNNTQEPGGDDNNTQEPGGDDNNTQEPGGDDNNTQEPGGDDNTQEPGGDDNTQEPSDDDEPEPEYTNDTPAQGNEEEVVVIEDNDTPLAATPVEPEEPAVGVLGAFDIIDNMVPLAALPATGSSTAFWLMMSVLSALGLAGTSMIDRKKRK